MYGAPDIIQIRRTFREKTQAVLWEQTVLRRLRVNKHPAFLNQHIGGAPPIMTGADNPSTRPEVRKMLSEHMTQNNPMRREDVREKMRQTIRNDYKHGRTPWNKGRTNCFTDDVIRRMRETRKGQTPWNADKTGVYSAETLDKMSRAKLGKPRGSMPEKTRKNISERRRGKRWYKSPDDSYSICCYPGEEPAGWKRGMIKRIKPIPPHLRKRLQHESKSGAHDQHES